MASSQWSASFESNFFSSKACRLDLRLLPECSEYRRASEWQCELLRWASLRRSRHFISVTRWSCGLALLPASSFYGIFIIEFYSELNFYIEIP